MKANSVARNYGRLTPEERFRLIMAANGRGDEAERERLVNAGGRITLSMFDHAPLVHAFDEIALLVFVELLAEASSYLESFHLVDDVSEWNDATGEGNDDDAIDEDEELASASEEDESDSNGNAGVAGGQEKREKRRTGRQRRWNLTLAAGFVLKVKADGWKLFCEQLTVPPFATWTDLPGFDRLERALALAEHAGFLPAGMVRWLNDVRPAGTPALSTVPLTVEGIADATAKMFQDRVDWWGG
jgi:hypothetical protein